jgi:hypothetical protein
MAKLSAPKCQAFFVRVSNHVFKDIQALPLQKRHVVAFLLLSKG